MSRQCPRCHVPFELLKKAFATIDTCPQCGGLFLDPGEGMALHGADSDPTFLVKDGRARQVGTSELACPNTSHPRRVMEVYAVGPDDAAVEIDHCGTCGGVFLDAGESEALEARMSAAPAQATLERTSFASPPGENQERAIQEARASSGKGFFTNLLTTLVEVGAVAGGGLAASQRYGRRHRRR